MSNSNNIKIFCFFFVFFYLVKSHLPTCQLVAELLSLNVLCRYERIEVAVFLAQKANGWPDLLLLVF